MEDSLCQQLETSLKGAEQMGLFAESQTQQLPVPGTWLEYTRQATCRTAKYQ